MAFSGAPPWTDKQQKPGISNFESTYEGGPEKESHRGLGQVKEEVGQAQRPRNKGVLKGRRSRRGKGG